MKRFPWLRTLVHLLGILPLARIGLDALTGGLSINPIQDIEQRLGRAALYFLVATLAVTPLATLTGWKSLPARRRALGLYSFLYASLHFFTFAVIDYGFDLAEIVRLIGEKPYILVGFSTGLLLLPLALTSFNYFMRKMGRRWKVLHRLIYPAGLLVILHYAWAKKGNLLALSGDILQPVLWGAIVIVLLLLRLRPVRSWISARRQALTRPERAS
jgi:sulfoxide reductase heme-binding subunit YedZ